MGKIALFGTMTAHEGKGDELAAAFAGLFEQVEREPGTEVYVLHRSQDDPNVFFFYELFTDADALEAHRDSDAMRAVGPVLGALVKQGERVIGNVVQASRVKT
jgi:quinol monooxygenase YgiN